MSSANEHEFQSDESENIEYNNSNRVYQSIESSLRQRVINFYQEGIAKIQISRNLDINYRTVCSIIRTWVVEGRSLTVQRGRKVGSGMVTNEIRDFVRGSLSSFNTYRLKDLQEKISEEFGLIFSIETVRTIVNCLVITLKRTTNINEMVNRPEIKESRKQYVEWYLRESRENEKNMVFIDESPLNLYMKRNYGYSPRGQRASQIIPASRGRNLTLISAINGEKVLYSVVIDGSARAVDFKLFLGQLLPILEEEGIKNTCTLIYDNASIHHASIIETFLEEQGIEYHYTSPYSYMINPIEFLFGKLKTFLRNESSIRNILRLSDIVMEGVQTISNEDLKGYFRHIRENCIKAIMLENF